MIQAPDIALAPLSSAPDAIRSAVLAADDDRRAAMVANDIVKLTSLLGDSLVYTHSTARRETRSEYLHSLTSGRVRYLEIDRQEARLDVYGTVVIMTGRSTIRAIAQGVPVFVGNMFQSVWVQGDIGWQMVAWTSVHRPLDVQ